MLDQTPEADKFESELTKVEITVNKLVTEEKPDDNTPVTPPTPSGNEGNGNQGETVSNGKRTIKLDLASRGERDTFVVKVIVEGQTVGRKVEYEANHKRSDGVINIAVSDIKGAMLKVYIDDKIVSEMVL